MNNIRNFCIIAHIDHGKSTLADRFLEITKTVDQRKMKAQVLDSMDLEREKGITIKLTPVRMVYQPDTDSKFILNLIDTPGHVDFNYEVSRSLAAVEGALLLVDATQGIQAQTLGNLYLALEHDLEIIPVVNKIDLPNADVKTVKEEIKKLLSVESAEILAVSAKNGTGVEAVLQKIVEKVPAPQEKYPGQTQALIFDSEFDDYRGVITYVRVFSGSLKSGDKIYMPGTATKSEVIEVGILSPAMKKVDRLAAGEIGYIVSGVKAVEKARVGDTILKFESLNFNLRQGHAGHGPSVHPHTRNAMGVPGVGMNIEKLILPGYKIAKPMVYAGLFTKSGEANELREALERLKLNDASLNIEPENSPALGHGFRCGFLGLLHLEIIQERLKREYGLELIVTLPSVAFKVKKTNEDKLIIHSPQELPDASQIEFVEEPWTRLDIVTPTPYLGAIMQLVQERKGEFINTEYLDEARAVLHYKIPLQAIIVDFYDKLKGISSGFASLSYEVDEWRRAEVARMDILVNEEKVEELSSLVYRSEAQRTGRRVVAKLKDTLPKQQFVLKIQAAIGGDIVASERLSALRKDVTAKLYGGDVTRKRKLLEKQKKGKKKMLSFGRVEIPAEAYLAVLKRE